MSTIIFTPIAEKYSFSAVSLNSYTVWRLHYNYDNSFGASYCCRLFWAWRANKYRLNILLRFKFASIQFLKCEVKLFQHKLCLYFIP